MQESIIFPRTRDCYRKHPIQNRAHISQ